jgi:hypothetical protein
MHLNCQQPASCYECLLAVPAQGLAPTPAGSKVRRAALWGLAFFVCVVMWGGRSFGLHTSKVRAKDRGHTYSLHRTHMGCLTWTVRAHVL